MRINTSSGDNSFVVSTEIRTSLIVIAFCTVIYLFAVRCSNAIDSITMEILEVILIEIWITFLIQENTRKYK